MSWIAMDSRARARATRTLRLLSASAVFLGVTACTDGATEPAADRFTVVTVSGWNDVVIDNRTGLMWTRDANLLALVPSINTGGFGIKMAEAELVRRVTNQERFAGYSDWRIPTIAEFSAFLGTGLAGRDFPGPFRNIARAHSYWSTTSTERCSTYVGCYQSYKIISSENGIAVESLKDGNAYLWMVRTP
jgi:hypothetical protein